MATCYRHPDRETGVSCSNCGRPICPECMTTTQVGMRCPECSRERTPVRTIRTLESTPQLTYALIALNVLAFLGEFVSGVSGIGGGLGASPLTAAGALNGPLVAEGEFWRIVTAGFLHSGLVHLLFNMFALWILGQILEPAIGSVRFGVVYFSSLLCGSFGALLVTPGGFTVGASGAVFGLMGAAFVIMRARGINPMESGLGVWIGLNLLITFVIPGISIGGHIGGLVGGALAGLAISQLDARAGGRALGTAVAVAIGVLAVAGSVAVA
jgi:membrane associated rhomboid family serine protease